jgi:hypothetical protein
MPRQHTVQQGDSIISLSKQFGIPVHKIWNHPDNRTLRGQSRKTSILLPGDVLTIPDTEDKWVDAATEERHRYRYSGHTTWLKLRFLRDGEPREGEPYRLSIDPRQFSGTLDEDGKLEVRIPADAHEGILYLGEPPNEERHNIRIGHLDPIGEATGVLQRLRSLGFPCPAGAELSDPRVRAALERFQAKNELEATGVADGATRNKLVELHGS